MTIPRPNTLFLLVDIMLGTATSTVAQQDSPHVGYVYPAGGQQGTTFEVLVGGKHLDGAATALVSGHGIQTEVVDYIRPLSQGQFKEIQNRMGDLKTKRRAASPEGGRRRGRRRSRPTMSKEWTPEADEDLTKIKQRLATFSIRRYSAPALVETVTLRVTVAPDAEPGQRGLRLLTGSGLSNPLVFQVGQLPEATERSGRSIAVEASQRRGGRGRKRQADARPPPGTSPMNDKPEKETDISLPVLLNGQILPGDVDRYRFQARRGQQLIVDVSARRLIPYLSDAVPGWFQATVALFDADGREVAYTDDFLFHPDPVLHVDVPADGEYVLEIRDALYRGREDFVYRVTVGELPFITGVFPLGTQAGTPAELEVRGWNLPVSRLRLEPLERGMHPVSLRTARGLTNSVPFAVGVLPECLEQERDNTPDTAQPVPFPVVVNGRVEKPGAVDLFRFRAEPGVRIVAEVRARRLGSPLDSLLRLTASDGAKLGVNDDFEDRAAGLTTHHADSRLSVTVPEDGLVNVSLSDTQQRGGRDFAYRLHLDRQQPSFELRIVPSSINARAGTTVPFKVHALRQDDFDGQIDLDPVDPRPGFALRGGRIPAGEDLIRCTLTVPATPSGSPHRLSLRGRGRAGGHSVTRMAVPADDVMQAFIYRHLVPADGVWVTITGSPRRTTASIPDLDELSIPPGGTVRIPVRLGRSSRFGATVFELSAPPEGIAIQGVSFGRRRAEITLCCDAARCRPGQEGNLILNVFAAKTGEDSGKGKEQRKKRRILLTALPAIPFRIPAEQAGLWHAENQQ